MYVNWVMNSHRPKNAFAIRAPSDVAIDSHLWRDSRVKEALSQELQKRGHSYSHLDSDVVIWLWGWISRPILPGPKHILWVIGHPDPLIPHIEEISQINWAGIYCASKSFTKILANKLSLPVEWLPCPGADRLPFSHKPEFNLAFVGNSDPGKGRDVLIPVFNRYSSNVVGNFPGATPSISWPGMQDIFNSGKIIPYTHHKDMSREGFVADAVLDMMKNSGALVLSDANSGVDDLSIPAAQWSTPEELYREINFYLGNEEARLAKVTRCRAAAAKFNMAHVAERMEKCFE